MTLAEARIDKERVPGSIPGHAKRPPLFNAIARILIFL